MSNAGFAAAFCPSEFSDLCAWVRRFAALGPVFRSWVALGCIECRCVRPMLANTDAYTAAANDAFAGFVEALLPDGCFCSDFTEQYLGVQVTFAEAIARSAANGTRLDHMQRIFGLATFIFTRPVLRSVLSARDIAWDVVVIDCFTRVVRLMEKDPTGKLFARCNWAETAQNHLILLEVGLDTAGPRVQNIFDSFSVLFARVEAIKKLALLTPGERGDLVGIHWFMLWASRIAQKFAVAKTVVRGETLFSLFSRFIVEHFIRDQFDCDKSASLFQRSLFQTALFTPLLSSHLLLAAVLGQHREGLPEFLGVYLSDSISVDDLVSFLGLLPLRWIAFCHMAMVKTVPIASRGTRKLAKLFMAEEAIGATFVPMFSLVQTSFGLLTEKNIFVSAMAHTYGLFEAHGDVASTVKQRFVFFFSLATLITDRLCSAKDFVQIARKTIECQLFLKPASIDQFVVQPGEIDLNEFADCIKTSKGNLWKLKDQKMCHPFYPWLNANQAMNHLLRYQQKFPDVLSPFPEIHPTEHFLEFRKTLSNPLLLALMFDILQDCTVVPELMSIETVHIILNFLLISSRENNCHDRMELESVGIASFPEFTNRIQTLTFSKVMWTPFELKYANLPPVSFVDLICRFGNLGMNCLVAMNIGYQVVEPEGKPDRRSRGRLLREQISQDFRERHASFEFDADPLDDEETTDRCNVCNQPPADDDVLCFPAAIFGLPVLDSPHFHGSCSFRICAHLVHEGCVHLSDGQVFRCPVDRLRRSLLLPKIDGIGLGEPSEKVCRLLRNFRISVTSMIGKGYDFEALIDTLTVTVVSFELRLRSLPNCLESKRNWFLIRNLFLIMWHFRHTFKLKCFNNEPELHRNFIARVIASEDPLNDFVKVASAVAQRLHGKQLLIFLRFAAIFGQLGLSESSDGLNWTELLTIPALSAKFGVEALEGIELECYGLMKLPNQFIDLMLPPFDLQIDDYREQVALCLVTGKTVSMERTGSSHLALVSHMDSEVKLDVTFILMLTGPFASGSFIVVKQTNSIRPVPGIYVDERGDDDIGFRRGALLCLNAERLEQYGDMLLSGGWTDFDTPL
jgi:hypothetical protein